MSFCIPERHFWWPKNVIAAVPCPACLACEGEPCWKRSEAGAVVLDYPHDSRVQVYESDACGPVKTTARGGYGYSVTMWCLKVRGHAGRHRFDYSARGPDRIRAAREVSHVR